MTSRLERLRADLIVSRPLLRTLLFCPSFPRTFTADDSAGDGFRLYQLEQKFNELRLEYITRSYRTPRDLFKAADWLERTDKYLDRQRLDAL